MKLLPILRIVLLVVFFFSTLWLSFAVGDVFPSPDENANFRFAQEVASSGDICIADDMTSLASGIVHPRSTAAFDGCIVPGSFLGFPVLAGIVGSWFGVASMTYVTPFFALMTVVLFWDGLRRLTRDERTADIASLLLMSAPPFWYYTARTMMHNVVMVAFLVLAGWLLLVARDRGRLLPIVCSGLAAGFAIFMRSFEAPWIAVLGVLALLMWPVFRHVKHIAVWILGCSLPVLAMLLLQWGTYGSPFATGYTVPPSGPVSSASVAAEVMASESWLDLVLPFGFDVKGILRNAWYYGFLLYPWMAIPAVAGIVLMLRRKGPARAMTIGAIALGVWLVVVYGSWTFADNPDPRAITIGNSHVRYWLPLFVLGAGFAAIAFRVLQAKIERHHPRLAQGALVTSMLVSVGLSGALVFWGGDGLVSTRAALPTFAEKREAILALTEPSAIIVVDRADKYLFPYRHVVVPLRSEQTYAALPELAAAGPLYYFGITFPAADMTYLNEVKLAALGLRIEFVQTMNEESLYRIVPL